MKAIKIARAKIAMIKPISQTTLFPELSGGNVGGAVEGPSVVTPPLWVGGVEDSGREASVVSAKIAPIPPPERNGANSHHAILPSRMPSGADLWPGRWLRAPLTGLERRQPDRL